LLGEGIKIIAFTARRIPSLQNEEYPFVASEEGDAVF